MARQRDYHAEYVARTERAKDAGFRSYGEMRSFNKENAGTLNAMRGDSFASAMWRESHPDTPDPRSDPIAASAFYDDIVVPYEAEGEVTGQMRHDAVAYFIDYEGMSEDEAIEAMRDIYGES